MTARAPDATNSTAPRRAALRETASAVELRFVTVADAHWHLDGLCELLQDAVDSGDSLGPAAPLSREDAEHDWEELRPRLSGDDLLWIAIAGSRIIGCIRLRLETSAGSGHRGVVERLAVHSSHRGRGVASTLLATAEGEALDRGRTLLLLDVESCSAAERFFERRGWQAAGTVPGFAGAPDGSLRAGTRRFKHLGSRDR